MRQNGKRLALHSETVRTLNDPELGLIAGGVAPKLLSRVNRVTERHELGMGPSGPYHCGPQPDGLDGVMRKKQTDNG